MHYLYKIILSIITVAFVSTSLAQEDNKYFPTGMIWKEVIAEPESVPLDTIQSTIFEIGSDTIINNCIYKQVHENGELLNIWLREDADMVWLLSDEYACEILLYNFNWIPESTLYTEYIRETDNGTECFKKYFSVNKSQAITLGTQIYQYLWEQDGTAIRGIGRVADLNRNCCLLGFRMPKEILPGIIYSKVLWIRKRNEEIFRSEVAEEWTIRIPTTNRVCEIINSKQPVNRIYDLAGRRLSTAQPYCGPYIQGGRIKARK